MNEILWIRISYWVAAIVDFIVAFQIFLPEMVGVKSYVYPMGLFSAAAVSWGLLLIFADRKPMERRWVLLPTMVVVVLLGLVSINAMIIGIIPLMAIIPSVFTSIFVFLLLLFSYIKSINSQIKKID